MEKSGLRKPQMGPGGFFPTNPDLANILGRMDFNFEKFYVFHFLDPKFLDFQVPRFPKSGLGRAWALGRAWSLVDALFSLVEHALEIAIRKLEPHNIPHVCSQK